MRWAGSAPAREFKDRHLDASVLRPDGFRRRLRWCRVSGLFDNPMGLMGFEFIEFAAPAVNTLEPLFEKMGFTLVAKHRSRDVVLYRQGSINFIVDREPGSIADHFAGQHGPSACGLAFRVKDAHKAYALALERGARPVDIPAGSAALRLPAIKGIGGAPLYLVDRFEDGKSIYDADFEFLPNADRHSKGHGFENIDRPTRDVCRGRMAFWGSFYERFFGFREIRFYDIDGEYTALASRAMTASAWQLAGFPSTAIPNDIYDDMLEGPPPAYGEPVEELKTRAILLEGSAKGGQNRLLLQILGEPLRGPAFFEFIQRKNDDGFGEGGFKALFESVEHDQMDPWRSAASQTSRPAAATMD
jgi:4-hydroxyphenylpyruvate dioxygenase